MVCTYTIELIMGRHQACRCIQIEDWYSQTEIAALIGCAILEVIRELELQRPIKGATLHITKEETA